MLVYGGYYFAFRVAPEYRKVQSFGAVFGKYDVRFFGKIGKRGTDALDFFSRQKCGAMSSASGVCGAFKFAFYGTDDASRLKTGGRGIVQVYTRFRKRHNIVY